MEVIEDREKGVLGFLGTVEELDVIDDQHVDQLIEMDEIIDRIVLGMIDKLVDELLRADVKDHFILVETLDLIADGLREMRLPQPHPAIDHQGVERIGARFLRDSLAGAACNTVAITFNKRIEGIYGIELRINLHLLQPGDDEGVLDGVIYNKREIHFIIGKRFVAMGRNIHRKGLVLMVTTVDHNPVLEHRLLPHDPAQGLRQQIYIMLFQVFVKELAGDLYDQY